MPINVAIADDHAIVTEGLSRLLSTQKQLRVTDTYLSGDRLLTGLQKRQPDVLLLDIQFPDTSGKELAKVIVPRYPDIRILVLSSVENIWEIKEMIQQGCFGYLLKNVDIQTLVEAIKQVHAGNIFFEQPLKEQLFASMLSPNKNRSKISDSNQQLTKREQQILEMVAKGFTNIQIAKELFLSYRTVQNNRLSLYQKFEVHNSAELIKVALLKGVIE